jgi:hypothetical protein
VVVNEGIDHSIERYFHKVSREDSTFYTPV